MKTLIVVGMLFLDLLTFPVFAQTPGEQKVSGKVTIVNNQSFDFSALRAHVFLKGKSDQRSQETDLIIRPNGTFELDLRLARSYGPGTSLILSVTSFDPTLRIDHEMGEPRSFYSFRAGESVIVGQREIPLEELSKGSKLEFKLIQGGAVVLGPEVPKEISGVISFIDASESSNVSSDDVFLFERDFNLRGIIFGGLKPGFSRMRLIDDAYGTILSNPFSVSQGRTVPVVVDWERWIRSRK